jgi:hypothetical protein
MKCIRFLPVGMLAALLGCAPSHTVGPVKIVAKSNAEVDNSGGSLGQGSARSLDRTAQPRVPLAPSDQLITVVEENLDQDPEPEQIIVVKRRDDIDSPIRLIMADQDPQNGQRYSPSWDSPTAATSVRIFTLTVKDLVGDHGLEIVVSGMNSQGKLTLNVFQRMPSESGRGVSFRSLCEISADDIQIEETDRPDTYSAEQKNGESFPIVTYDRDPESPNVMDLVRVPWTWKAAEGRYVAGAAEKIPGEKVEQARLKELYTSTDTGSYERFLDGAWTVLGQPTASAPEGRPVEIIHFEPSLRRISRYLGDAEEVYIWSESYKTLYNLLIVVTKNEVVPSIAMKFSIRATDMNTLEISIQGVDTGDTTTATYVKLTEEIQRKYLTRNGTPVTLPPASLKGVYLGATGTRIEFLNQKFAWTVGETTRQGSFVLFMIAEHEILSVRFFDDNGLPAETKNYLVEKSERRELNRVTTTVTLSPVLLAVSGYQETIGDPLTLTHTDEPQKK